MQAAVEADFDFGGECFSTIMQQTELVLDRQCLGQQLTVDQPAEKWRLMLFNNQMVVVAQPAADQDRPSLEGWMQLRRIDKENQVANQHVFVLDLGI